MRKSGSVNFEALFEIGLFIFLISNQDRGDSSSISNQPD